MSINFIDHFLDNGGVGINLCIPWLFRRATCYLPPTHVLGNSIHQDVANVKKPLFFFCRDMNSDLPWFSFHFIDREAKILGASSTLKWQVHENDKCFSMVFKNSNNLLLLSLTWRYRLLCTTIRKTCCFAQELACDLW